MSLLDLTIIYFACGTPFGVYFFLTNRHKQNLFTFWFKSLLVVLLWIPFATQLLATNVTKKLKKYELFDNSRIDFKLTIIDESKKRFERYLSLNNPSLSLFELREVIDRYSGLTLAAQEQNSEPSNSEKELYKISDGDYSGASSVCLKRRNQKKLLSHQKYAREDFLNTIKKLQTDSNENNLSRHTLEFVKLIEDDEALASISSLFDNSAQTSAIKPVSKLEKDLWKDDIPTPQTDQPIPARLRTLTATANSPTKD